MDTWDTLEAWVEKEAAGSRLALALRNAESSEKAEQMTAYKQLVRWQYDYYVTNKSFYCFFTGQGLWLVYSMNDYSSYFGGESSQTCTTIASQSDGDATSSSTTVTIVSTSKLDPLTTTGSTTGIWEETGEKLAKTWLTIGIILVLLIALAVVVVIKKRKGY